MASFTTLVISAALCALASGPGRNHPSAQKQCSGEFDESPQTENAIRHFRKIIQHVQSRTPALKWPSEFLQNRPIQDPQRAIDIVMLVAADGSALHKELEMMGRGAHGDTQSAVTWNQYLRSYDKAVASLPQYHDVYLRANEYLSKSNPNRHYSPLILDAGSGTGNGALLLTILDPGRDLRGIDLTRVGTDLAIQKFDMIRGGNNSARFKVGNLLELSDKETYDGIIMNNTLFFVPTLEEKEQILERLFAALKPGGILVFNDPRPKLQKDDFAIQAQIRILSAAAVRNPSINEFDIANMAYTNLYKIRRPGAYQPDLSFVVRKIGFQIIKMYDTYFHASRTLVLKKP